MRVGRFALAGNPEANDYIDAISNQFNLHEPSTSKKTPTPILQRPSTKEMRRAAAEQKGARVQFSEPVEPYVPVSLRELDGNQKTRATLHEHAANEKIRTAMKAMSEGDDNVTQGFEPNTNTNTNFKNYASSDEEDATSEHYIRSASREGYNSQPEAVRKAQSAKMAKLKAKLGGAAPPKSPKPKNNTNNNNNNNNHGRPPESNSHFSNSPFFVNTNTGPGTVTEESADLPPPSPNKPNNNKTSSYSKPKKKNIFPAVNVNVSVVPPTQPQPAALESQKEKDSRRLLKLKTRIAKCKQSRQLAIKSRLDPRSTMIDETVQLYDKTSARHQVECARIQAVANNSSSTMVSSILVENGSYRAKSAAMVKVSERSE